MPCVNIPVLSCAAVCCAVLCSSLLGTVTQHLGCIAGGAAQGAAGPLLGLDQPLAGERGSFSEGTKGGSPIARMETERES